MHKLPLIPFRAEIHRHDAPHLARGGENGAVGAVKGAPGVLIGPVIHGGSPKAGQIEGVRIDHRGAEFRRVPHGGIHGEEKLSIRSGGLDAVDIPELNIILEVGQNLHGSPVVLRVRVRRGEAGEGVPVQHGRRRVGNVQHTVLHQGDQGAAGLPGQQEAQDRVDEQQEGYNEKQETVFSVVLLCFHDVYSRLSQKINGNAFRNMAVRFLPSPIKAGKETESHSSSSFSTARKASVGIWTLPRERIRFLPSFCFSSSFFFRVMSPP